MAATDTFVAKTHIYIIRQLHTPHTTHFPSRSRVSFPQKYKSNGSKKGIFKKSQLDQDF
jgi:hypothetical protein